MANVFDAMNKHRAEQKNATPQTAAEAATDEASPPPPSGAEAPLQSADASAKRRRVPLRKTLDVSLPGISGNGDARYAEELIAHHDRGSMATEQYRALRTNLLAQYTDGRFTLAITSAESGEGKTVTALNLALVLAERPEYRTVVIDGDLRKCTIAQMLTLDRSPGLAEILRGEASLDEAIRTTAYPNLSVIPSGRAGLQDVSTLLGGPELAELFHALKKNYDHVIVDTPPVNVVSDTGMLGRVAGEALMVLRMNKTRRESVEKAVRLLHAAKIEVAGMVLTHQQFHIPNYIYRYS